MQFEDPIVNTDVLGLDPVANTGEHFQRHYGIGASEASKLKVNQSSTLRTSSQLCTSYT